MLISVVTAVYNRAGTIAEAMASVQAQDYPHVEHVIQDGGSTDGTCAAIARVADSRTRVSSGADAGLYDAINRGLAVATGEVVGLVHSDDFFAAPDILSDVAAVFADATVDAVYGDLDYVSAADTGRTIRRWRSGPFGPDRLASGWMPPHPTLFLRRAVFERHGPYDTRYRISADYDAILRYFSEPGFRAVHIPKVFVKMRVGGESNGSVGRILRKSHEDYRALRANGVGGLGTLARKNLAKIPQFVALGRSGQ